MKTRSPEVDAFHAAIAPPARRALEAIRRAVHAAAPGAVECLFYGMPAVRYEGKPLVAWRAAAKHCAFHPLSGKTVAACAELLAEYDTSPGTVRFAPDHPLPAALVRRMVALRIAENRSRGAAKPTMTAGPRRRASGVKRFPAKGTRARRPSAGARRASASKRRSP